MSTRPLLEGYAPGAVIGFAPEGPLDAGAFIGAVQSLAARLPEGGSGFLLCEDRLDFAIGFAAMLSRGITALLPPSHAPAALARIARTRRAAFALVDRPGTRSSVPEIAVDRRRAGGGAPMPLIADDHVAAVVYTSGTTGEPQPHPKSWSSLVRGACALRDRVGIGRGSVVVGAVPPQHMWGLEATVMLPLLSGAAMHASVPLLPEDIGAALAGVPAPRWLVATPLHLASCVRAGTRLPVLAGALSATTPLDAELAAAFARTSGVSPIEIYGSTETGVIATRRPETEARFTPVDGLTLRVDGDELLLAGGHLDGEVALADRAAIEADGRFALLGRDTDLVKVGGKRASLAMLTRELRAIPGVVDAEYVVADSRALAPRLAALVVAPGLDRAAILGALRQRIDPVFLPRPLHLVARLPRNAVGKAPAEALRKLLARLARTREEASP